MIRGQTILVDGGYTLPVEGISWNQGAVEKASKSGIG
jgi:hypothetical protein